jgi:hypothetical protein
LAEPAIAIDVLDSRHMNAIEEALDRDVTDTQLGEPANPWVRRPYRHLWAAHLTAQSAG